MQSNTKSNQTVAITAMTLLVAAGGSHAGITTLETGHVVGDIEYNTTTGVLSGSGVILAAAGTADAGNFDLSDDLVTWDLAGSGGPEGDFTISMTGAAPPEFGPLVFAGEFSATGTRTSFGLFGTLTLPTGLIAALNLGPQITAFALSFTGFNVTGGVGDTVIYTADPAMESFGVFGTPTPGTASLLGLGGLVACRRRRSQRAQ